MARNQKNLPTSAWKPTSLQAHTVVGASDAQNRSYKQMHFGGSRGASTAIFNGQGQSTSTATLDCSQLPSTHQYTMTLYTVDCTAR